MPPPPQRRAGGGPAPGVRVRQQAAEWSAAEGELLRQAGRAPRRRGRAARAAEQGGRVGPGGHGGARRVPRARAAAAGPGAGRGGPGPRTPGPRADFLGAAVDLDEAYAWGWSEVKRLEAEMARVAGQIVPGGTLEQAVAALEADPARQIHGREKLKAWMQELRGPGDRRPERQALRHPGAGPADRVHARADERRRYLLHRPERGLVAGPAGCGGRCRRASRSSPPGGGHHRAPRGRTRPPPPDRRRRSTSKDRLNRWQRRLCWVSGHGEGWALYAERLMDELGIPRRPGRPARHAGQPDAARRRVVVDLGVHLQLPVPAGTGWHDGEVWNAELAWDSCARTPMRRRTCASS